MEEGYLIGVDGGGTKTKAVAARTDGTVLATAVGGGLNAGQPLHLPRMRTRSVSYYAFFEGWLLLSQLPDCLSLHTSFST